MPNHNLWSDCPYWPEHRFKNDVCTECGFQRPKLSGLIKETRNRNTTLEYKINIILHYREKIATFDNIWGNTLSLSDVYGKYEYSGYFGRKKLAIHPSAPLRGEKKKTRRRLRKVYDLIKFHEEHWPIIKRNLDDLFTTRPVEPHVRSHVDAFIHSLMFFGNTLTYNQTEQLAAAYTYYLSDLTERQVAEDPDSFFPNVTRKTLRKWVGFVRRFEEVSLG